MRYDDELLQRESNGHEPISTHFDGLRNMPYNPHPNAMIVIEATIRALVFFLAQKRQGRDAPQGVPVPM